MMMMIMTTTVIPISQLIFIFTILLNSLELSTAEYGADEQLADINPNDANIEKYFEESKSLIEQGDERQPKVDVKLELSRLNFSHSWESTWPKKSRKLGSVSAVSFDNSGNVVVFHRGNHVWDGSTFDPTTNIYLPRAQGPITQNTIIAFNRNSGDVTYEWGNGLFYMPHGLTIDHDDNVWITDVALHQVMKFSPNNHTKPEFILGTAFQPGNSQNKFCKPTAVAVLPNGDFFVSDGYCNARIIKYAKSGERILSWGHNSFHGVSFDHAPRSFFAIPHAMALASDLGLLCVADRENGRVQCFKTDNGTFHSQYHSGIIGDRLFSVAYAPVNGGQLYVVNGPEYSQTARSVMGFVIHMQSNTVVAKFGPNDGVFDNPHDIKVSPNGNEIYIAQLAPNIVFKFNSKMAASTKTISDSSSTILRPSVTSVQSVSLLPTKFKYSEEVNTQSDSQQTNRQMLFIIGLFVSFICITLFAILFIARRRKLDSRNRRRHAWDFPTVKTDGFKLGNLLERNGKRGFEKLDQEASDRSDDEPNSSTNALLSNAQFT